jgi:GH18 family chitinase
MSSSLSIPSMAINTYYLFLNALRYEPHSGTPNDGESWNLLLNDLRAALDELEEETGHYYGITA